MKSRKFFLRFFPKMWCRYWSARLIATTVCADKWISVDNQNFTRKQLAARSLLIWSLFLIPVKLSVRVSYSEGRIKCASTT